MQFAILYLPQMFFVCLKKVKAKWEFETLNYGLMACGNHIMPSWASNLDVQETMNHV